MKKKAWGRGGLVEWGRGRGGETSSWGYSQSCCTIHVIQQQQQSKRETASVYSSRELVVRQAGMGIVHPLHPLPETPLFKSKLNERVRCREGEGDLRKHPNKQPTLSNAAGNDHLIFRRARNSPHWINLCFPTSTPASEQPSTSHLVSPPVPNRRGWYHTPPYSLTQLLLCCCHSPHGQSDAALVLQGC